MIFIHYTSDIFGGSDKSLFELVGSLSNSITPVMILKKSDPMIGSYQKLGVKVHTVSFFGPPKKLFTKRAALFLSTFLPSVISVLNIIRKEKPSVIHVNTSLNIQGGLAAYLSRVPLVWHIREILGDSVLDDFVKRVVSKLSTQTIAISKAVQDNYKPRNCVVVYNGMDLTEYKDLQRNTNKSEEIININCIGRLEEWKGQHILLETVPRLLELNPNVKITFIGGEASSKPEYSLKLKHRGNELNINKNVVFAGIKKNIPEILANTDILVTPTSTSEPFGRTIIEGMASGCIVVATAAGGPLEIIDDGVTGYLVTPNSVDELAQKIMAILLNLSKLNYIGINAKKEVEKKYDIKRVGSEVEQVFLSVKCRS